jgi:hypothetical protein
MRCSTGHPAESSGMARGAHGKKPGIEPLLTQARGISMPIAIRRIHSKYLGDKAFPKDITEFEIREFFS